MNTNGSDSAKHKRSRPVPDDDCVILDEPPARKTVPKRSVAPAPDDDDIQITREKAGGMEVCLHDLFENDTAQCVIFMLVHRTLLNGSCR